ncbi:hypothetical protein [Paraclostridium sordellii]|uniref:hypothetical protein n=1 Tax=Paraclostridium sordellii TaxID=1505 RepID=UPI0005E93D4C|nr:hypothetical protein [Paeniclostridium sordellii]CEN86379.1 Gp6 protein [[Clostridium] sordellii] [Paeniclostridium sordellii]
MLDELKQNLQITWDDEEIKQKLERSLSSGKEYLNYIAGVEIDFDNSTFAKNLLLEYGRYSYNNAVEYFETNFQKELTHLQIMNVVKKDVQ